MVEKSSIKDYSKYMPEIRKLPQELKNKISRLVFDLSYEGVSRSLFLEQVKKLKLSFIVRILLIATLENAYLKHIDKLELQKEIGKLPTYMKAV